MEQLNEFRRSDSALVCITPLQSTNPLIVEVTTCVAAFARRLNRISLEGNEMRKIHMLMVCTLSVGLVACSSSRPEKGAVAREWSTNTEQLSIRPIYPPSAIFEVGDIYVVRAAKVGSELKTADYYMSSKRFDRINLDKELIRAAPHINPAKTPKEPSSTVKVMSVPDLFVPDTQVKINSLVAFPGFTFASLAESEIGVGVTNSSIAALFGAGRKSGYSVAYSVPLAETYGVLYGDASIAVADHIQKYDDKWRAKLRQAANSLSNTRSRDAEDVSPVLVLVTQIYLARSLDVIVTSTESSGAQISAVTRALTDLDERKKALETQLRALNPPAKGAPAADSGGAQAPAAGAVAKDAGTTAGASDKKAVTAPVAPVNQAAINQTTAELEQVNEQIRQRIEAVTPDMPGATGSVVKSSASGVTLRLVFEYPVAIGYEGVNIDVEEFLANKNIVEPKDVLTFPLQLQKRYSIE